MSKHEETLNQLRVENDMLKALLASHGISLPQQLVKFSAALPPLSEPSVLSPDEKIKLFRRLFKGRNDVYPVRWESKKTGKPGYSPVCANEWRQGVCQKPAIKCSECQHIRTGTALSRSIQTSRKPGKEYFFRLRPAKDFTGNWMASNLVKPFRIIPGNRLWEDIIWNCLALKANQLIPFSFKSGVALLLSWMNVKTRGGVLYSMLVLGPVV